MFRYIIMIGVLILTLTAPALHAEISFEPILTEYMDEPVLDMATNPDQGLIFFLTPSAVLLYSPNEKDVIDRIPLKDRFDRVDQYGEDQLILTRSQPAWVQIIQYSRIFSIDIANRAFKGQADAKVTIVVFDDYQCPYCARLERFVEQVLEQFPTGVKYVIKHFPLSSHAFAHNGAMAALAAGKQGKFWEFHGRLLENHDQVNEQKIQDIAGELKLDMERFKKDRQSASSRKLIQEDIKNGRDIGVSGTPSAFINGKRIRNQDLGRLPELIIRELGDK